MAPKITGKQIPEKLMDHSKIYYIFSSAWLTLKINDEIRRPWVIDKLKKAAIMINDEIHKYLQYGWLTNWKKEVIMKQKVHRSRRYCKICNITFHSLKKFHFNYLKTGWTGFFLHLQLIFQKLMHNLYDFNHRVIV